MGQPSHLVQVVAAALRGVAKELMRGDDEMIAVQPGLRRHGGGGGCGGAVLDAAAATAAAAVHVWVV